MGVVNAELWNNLGLCCFYASQYDMTLTCFERALQVQMGSTLPCCCCLSMQVLWRASARHVMACSNACALNERDIALHTLMYC